MISFYVHRIVHTGLSSSVPDVVRYAACVDDSFYLAQRETEDEARADATRRFPDATEVDPPDA